MKKTFRFVAAWVLVTIAGCTSSPGALQGTWKADGLVPMTITFRPGETEAMGVVEHVDYSTSGNVVNVTYKDGLMKGSSIRFVMVDANVAKTQMYTLHRVR